MARSYPTEMLDSFRRFNEGGGKFRLAILNACNLDCFFCHNEGMDNPRRGPWRRDALGVADLVGLANAWAELGGEQINITGGEPLAHPELAALLGAIDKRSSRIAVNTNALLADRLVRQPRIEAIDRVLASLHTVDDEVARRTLGAKSARAIVDAIVALAKHGYRVELNYSLSADNRDGFDAVLDVALANGLDLKAIALVRSSEAPGYYGGDWVDPSWIAARLAARGAVEVRTRAQFGGRRTTYRLDAIQVEVKNIAEGRLRTDFCRGCLHEASCGEGIYGLRVGVDGLFKPCLLRRDRFREVDTAGDLVEQVLATVHAMVGVWSHARFVGGAPA